MAEANQENRKGARRRRPAFQIRISTKYAPRKVANGEARSCIKETSLSSGQMLELYRYLKLTRLVEERIVNLYRQTKVVGGVYRSLGQEATAVGSAYALRPDDFITPIIRDLGACFVKGIRPREIFAQYMAKAWGPSGGKDLNVHFGYMDKGFIGPISHLGDMIPVMTGILLGARMQKRDIVGLAYIGDGGASTGAFYEGLNFVECAGTRTSITYVSQAHDISLLHPRAQQYSRHHGNHVAEMRNRTNESFIHIAEVHIQIFAARWAPCFGHVLRKDFTWTYPLDEAGPKIANNRSDEIVRPQRVSRTNRGSFLAQRSVNASHYFCLAIEIDYALFHQARQFQITVELEHLP